MAEILNYVCKFIQIIYFNFTCTSFRIYVIVLLKFLILVSINFIEKYEINLIKYPRKRILLKKKMK